MVVQDEVYVVELREVYNIPMMTPSDSCYQIHEYHDYHPTHACALRFYYKPLPINL